MPPLKIDLDIAAGCAPFHASIAPLVQAVRNAEGGSLYKAVKLSVPNVADEAEAIRITARSAVHQLNDFVRLTVIGGIALDDAFVKFWAKKWAPVGAKNDPTSLNQFWTKNVLSAWRKR